MKEHFSPKQVALALDVSESSIKRWCDQGAIHFVRTVGGHRRVTRQALNDFLAKSNRTLAHPEVLNEVEIRPVSRENSSQPIGIVDSTVTEKVFDELRKSTQGVHFQDGKSDLVDSFVKALVNDDDATCRAIFLDLRSNGFSVAQLGDRLICPALRKLGEEWSCFRIDIYQERRSCEILIGLIRDLVAGLSPTGHTRFLAIGAAPSDDPYTLPGHIIEAMMKEMGWRAKNLGVNIPFDSLLRAAIREKPNMFWLSVSSISDETTFVPALNHFHDSLPTSTRLVVGGRALSPAVRANFPKISFCDSLEQLRGYAIAIESLLKSAHPR